MRVGHALGRGDPAAVKRAGFVAIGLGIALVAALTLAVIASRFAIARLFFGADDSANAAVELAATLLLIGATFFVADGVLSIAAGSLRGQACCCS